MTFANNMKTLIALVALVLVCHTAWAQNDLSALQQAWCRDRYISGGMNANEKRAVDFEQKVQRRIATVQQRANAILLPLTYPQIVQTPTSSLTQSRYRQGSMSPRYMEAYEAEINSVLASLESQASQRERMQHQAWRQANPVEARIEDAQNAASDAESRAASAEAEAERKTREARASEVRAINAENLARQRQQEAKRQEERSRQLEWQAQQAEQRAREAESRSRW